MGPRPVPTHFRKLQMFQLMSTPLVIGDGNGTLSDETWEHPQRSPLRPSLVCPTPVSRYSTNTCSLGCTNTYGLQRIASVSGHRTLDEETPNCARSVITPRRRPFANRIPAGRGRYDVHLHLHPHLHALADGSRLAGWLA